MEERKYSLSQRIPRIRDGNTANADRANNKCLLGKGKKNFENGINPKGATPAQKPRKSNHGNAGADRSVCPGCGLQATVTYRPALTIHAIANRSKKHEPE